MREYRLKHRDNFGGLQLVDAPMPKLTSPTQILIKVRAICLNARDIQIATSTYPAPHPLPDNIVPVSDASGEVVEIGKEVKRFAKGDKVCPIIMQGHHFEQENNHLNTSLGGAINGVATEFFVCDESDAVKFPSRLTFLEAATLPVAYLTSWTALFKFEPKIKAGQIVLAMGTGGCSIAALQLAKAAGCKCIVTSSSDDKLNIAKTLGADACINYKEHLEWDKEVKKLSDGVGVDYVVEVSGGDTLNRSIRSCRKGGVVSIIGYLSDYGSKTGGGEDVAKTIMYAQAQVKGVLIGGRQDFENMNRAIEAASFQPVVDSVFKFEDLPKAYAHLEKGLSIGKVVVEVA